MNRSALVRTSDAVVISLMEHHEAIQTAEGGPFIGDYDSVPDYIGHGNKLAVHRAGLAPSR
jgi:hypothetical protein